MGKRHPEILRTEVHRYSSPSRCGRRRLVVGRRLGLRHGDARELLVDRVALTGRLLRVLEESLEAGGVAALDDPEPRLVAHVLGDERFRGPVVEMHRRLSFGDAPRIEAVERPHARVDRQLLLGRAVRHVVAVRDAMAVGDDERRPRVRLGFEKGLDGLAHFRAEGHPRHIDVAVHVGEQAEVLLLGRLAGRRELGHRAERRRLRLLAAGIGIDLGVEHEDVHVTLAGQDVVEAAVADVVGPPVAPHQPDALFHEVIGERFEAARFGRRERREHLSQRAHPLALRPDPRFRRLVGVEQFAGEALADRPGHVFHQRARRARMAVHAEAHAEAEFRVVLEQRVRPRRPAPVAVRRERRGRQVAAVNRRAARGVRHEGAVAEELREQLDVRRFAAPGARPRVLEQRLEELRRLVIDFRQIDARGVGQVEKERVVVPLGVAERRLRVHVDRFVPGVRPIFGRADVHAQVAARAVLRRHLNRVRPRL